MPELPEAMQARFVRDVRAARRTTRVALTASRALADYFEAAVDAGADAKIGRATGCSAKSPRRSTAPSSTSRTRRCAARRSRGC